MYIYIYIMDTTVLAEKNVFPDSITQYYIF